MTTDSRLRLIFEKIDAANNQDPNKVLVDGEKIAKELLYSMRMTDELKTYSPDASEALQIASRAQHIERWTIARTDFPEGRSGYKKWRSKLALHHAEKTASLMHLCKYDETQTERVKYLLKKRGLNHGVNSDPETQCLEDVICLVFLKYYLEDFSKMHTEEKLINILRLTWGKMSTTGQKSALQLKMDSGITALLGKALK